VCVKSIQSTQSWSISSWKLCQGTRKRVVICDNQNGFTLGKPCLTNTCGLLWWYNCISGQRKSHCIIYLFFSKAFDTVHHNILLSKLERYGFDRCIVSWMRNCLQDRTQRVVVNGLTSGWRSVTGGAPQGSALGPTLSYLRPWHWQRDWMHPQQVCGWHQLDMPEGWDAIQREPRQDQAVSPGEPPEVLQIKHKVLQLGRGNSHCQYKLGDKRIEHSPVDRGILVDGSWPHSWTAWALQPREKAALGDLRVDFLRGGL